MYNERRNTADLTYFYSEPLVEKHHDPITNKKELRPLGAADLETEYEYLRLSDVLKRTGYQFNINKKSINFETLKETILEKPSIIHISCHGDYSK